MYVIAYMRGSPAEGLGHISRCAAVCHALSARGVNIAVILDGGAFATRHLAARGLQPVTLSEAMAQGRPDAWLLDALEVPADIAVAMRRTGRVVLLSPRCTQGHLASEAYLRIPFVGQIACEPHVGRQWAVVGGEHLPSQRASADERLTLAIILSGGSNLRLTAAIAALLPDPDLCQNLGAVQIAVGGLPFSQFATLDHLTCAASIALIRSASIWDDLGHVDIVVCGDGVVVDEACARGKVIVVYTDTERAAKVEDLVAARAVALATDTQQLHQVVKALLASSEQRQALAQAALRAVDGAGATRIADAILGQRP